MASADLNLLKECMNFFKNEDPRVYEKFIRVLDQYVNELTVAVTEVAPEAVMEARGRAQIARKFLQMFTECSVASNRPTP